MSELIFLPIVRSNAFIGMNEYQERLQTTLQDALRLKRSMSIDESLKIQNSRKRKRDEVCAEKYTRLEFVPSDTIKSNLQIETTVEKSIDASRTANGNSTTGCDLLIRNKSFIHVDQQNRKQKILHESSKENSRKRKQTEDCLENYINNELVTPKLQSTIEYSIQGNTKTDGSSTNHGNHLLVRTESFTNLDRPSKRQKTLQKSDPEKDKLKTSKIKLEIYRRRLLKMEEAVQEWNKYFGTKYTLLKK